jgi:[1-hydroxy-2-(trimethylamino)ethyl]phosphonate dioxygenase
MSTAVDQILAIFHARGDQAYLGEPVSLTEHMLQTAGAARRDGAPAPMIAAALLHDFGHLVHGMDEDAAEDGVDTQHEVVGARWLSRSFGLAVTEPIRLHVEAKRYLCATDPTYVAQLSAASVHSLTLQGGAMSIDEAIRFEAQPFAADAVQLRKWDDAAKTVGVNVASLASLRPLLELCRTASTTHSP